MTISPMSKPEVENHVPYQESIKRPRHGPFCDSVYDDLKRKWRVAINLDGLGFYEEQIDKYDGRPIKLLRSKRYSLCKSAVDRLGNDEVNHACCIGVLQAVRLFEPDKGYSFGTFALPWMALEVREFLHGPVKTVNGIRKGQNDWWASYARLDWPTLDGQELLRDMIQSRDAATQSNIDIEDANYKVDFWLSKLNSRHAFILRECVVNGKSCAEVGQKIGVASNTISGVMKTAIKHLRLVIEEYS